MDKPLVQQIQDLNNALEAIKAELEELSKNTAEKTAQPYTKSGGNKDQSQQKSTDISTGLGQTFAGAVIWNDSELTFPAFGTKPDDPTKGYNRHSHSRYSGGALDINTLEIVEYDIDWDVDATHHKDCQSLWKTTPAIKKTQNTNNENVDKIGSIDLVFDPDKSKWGAVAYEIDVKKCYFVLRDENGDIELDENGEEKKAPLYNEDESKTNIIWDKLAKCWRLYAVYAETPEEEE